MTPGHSTPSPAAQHSETVDVELRYANGETTVHSRASLHLWTDVDGSVERTVVLASPVPAHLHGYTARLEVLRTHERWTVVSPDGRTWSETAHPL
jgi:hypothetical protein